MKEDEWEPGQSSPEASPPLPGVVQPHFHFPDTEVHLNMYFDPSAHFSASVLTREDQVKLLPATQSISRNHFPRPRWGHLLPQISPTGLS